MHRTHRALSSIRTSELGRRPPRSSIHLHQGRSRGAPTPTNLSLRTALTKRMFWNPLTPLTPFSTWIKPDHFGHSHPRAQNRKSTLSRPRASSSQHKHHATPSIRGSETAMPRAKRKTYHSFSKPKMRHQTTSATSGTDQSSTGLNPSTPQKSRPSKFTPSHTPT